MHTPHWLENGCLCNRDHDEEEEENEHSPQDSRVEGDCIHSFCFVLIVRIGSVSAAKYFVTADYISFIPVWFLHLFYGASM